MLNHLKRFLMTDLRYKWLLINLVVGTFFMIAPYVYMVSTKQQVLTLKGDAVLVWTESGNVWDRRIRGRRKNGWNVYQSVSVPGSIPTVLCGQGFTDYH